MNRGHRCGIAHGSGSEQQFVVAATGQAQEKNDCSGYGASCIHDGDGELSITMFFMIHEFAETRNSQEMNRRRFAFQVCISDILI